MMDAERPQMMMIDRAAADAEIVWGKRFFRPGVWAHELVPKQDFIPWSSPSSMPAEDIETAVSLINPLDGGEMVLLIGLFVVEALRRNADLNRRCRLIGTFSPVTLAKVLRVNRIVTLGTVFNAGWSDRMEVCVHPKHALLLSSRLAAGADGLIAQERGSSWEMTGPGRGVLFLDAAHR